MTMAKRAPRRVCGYVISPVGPFVFEALIVPTVERLSIHIGQSRRNPTAACWVTITVSNDLFLPFGDTLPSAGRIFNSSALQMGLLTYRKRGRAKNRGEEKAHSDEIDLYLKEEAKSLRRLCSVLLISSCPYIVTWGTMHPPLIRTFRLVGLLGIPESESAASAIVKQMKLVHGTHEECSDFRPLIWKTLLQNIRSIVKDIGSRNKVRCVFYTSPIP